MLARRQSMTTATNTFTDIVSVACGQALDADASTARRGQLVLSSALGAIVLSAIWGVAAGSTALDLAAANLLKVPMVIVLASLCALPVGLVTLKLSGARFRPMNLVLGYASSVFGATLIMAVLAPLVAVYYHTSAAVADLLAIGSCFLAIGAALLLFARSLRRHAEPGAARLPLAITAAVLAAVNLAALLQFVAIAAPILPDDTIFSGGVDQLLR
jgi:hypothetical protein